MSKVTDLVEREAALAEAGEEAPDETENPDAEPAEPIEPDEEEEQDAEQEEAPAEPSSLALVEDQGKQLDAEERRHAKALSKILGEHWTEFAQCPLCQVDGYAMPYQPGEVGPEQREAVMAVLGESGRARYAKHPWKRKCPDCRGLGKLDTESEVEAYMFDICDSCGGNGTRDSRTPEPQPPAAYQPPAWTPPPPAFDPSQVNRDPWGREPGNPNWGVDPATNGGLW